MIVYNYLCNYSLKQLISKKIDKYDLIIIKQKLSKLNNKSESEVYEYISKQQKKYDNLSIVDSYILHIILKEYYQNDINRMISKIKSKVNNNDSMHYKKV